MTRYGASDDEGVIWSLHAGPYQESDDSGDHLITDPPYGARTHRGHNEAHRQVTDATGQPTRRAISYQHWTPEDVHALVSWTTDPVGGAPRIGGWRVCMTSHDLVPAYEEAYKKAGLYAFAPVPLVIPRPRLLGDGPPSWLIYLMIARPRIRAFMSWGCTRGEYRSSCERKSPVVGAKRLEVMAQIVSDYSRPNDVVVDPCAGYASTGVASLLTGRLFRGSEVDATLAEKAATRLDLASAGEIRLKPGWNDAKEKRDRARPRPRKNRVRRGAVRQRDAGGVRPDPG